MGSSAVAISFLIFLFCAVQSSSWWSVTYPSERICAIKGSTVKIHCNYNHPHEGHGTTIDVTERFWFTKIDQEPEDVKSQDKYAGRVEYSCEQRRCTLTINDLKESDAAVYKFRFITNKQGGSYTGEPGVRLSVTDLYVAVQHTSQKTKLECSSSCFLPDYFTYVWYKNGINIYTGESTRDFSVDTYDSMSCAVKGYEEFPSRSVCVRGTTCNTVIYRNKRICAFKGSTVAIYSHYYSASYSQFWFSPGRSKEWSNPSQPESLEYDSQYADRVKVIKRKEWSTLTITNLRESDSAEYRFIYRGYRFNWGKDLHGTTLTVTALQVQVTKTSSIQTSTYAELKCHSSCSPPGNHDYIWYRNGQKLQRGILTYEGWIDTTEKISCAVFPHEDHRAPEVYAPLSPSLSAHPSGDIVEGNTVFLNCSSEANPPAKYTWYKKTKTSTLKLLPEDSQFSLRTIQWSDAAEYYCVAKNQLGERTSSNLYVDVKYAPKYANVSLSQMEIVEGSSVNLTCRSDGNPAPHYTWYKDNLKMLQRQGSVYQLTSVRSEESGMYLCEAGNTYGLINSSSVYINVEYSPRLPSVSVSQPEELAAGSSVNLTCSSVANPAPTYVWFKEHSTTPTAHGQRFTIENIRPEHGGHFYCQARNSWGQHNSTLQLIEVSSSAMSAVVGSITFILLLVVFILFAFIIFRNKMAARQISEITERPGDNRMKSLGDSGRYLETPSTARLENSTDQNDVYYATVHFSKNQQDEPLYSNFTPVESKTPQNREDEDVEYSVVTRTPCLRNHDASMESSSLYSTVNKV